MDPIEQGLRDKLACESLTPREVQAGITACFVLTNRKFVRRRVGDERPTTEIDAATMDLVEQVYAEENISAEQPLLMDLRRAWHILDEQLGFEAEPELFAHHRQIIQRLFALAARKKYS